MPIDMNSFLIGVLSGGVLFSIYAFLSGYFRHFGESAAEATLSMILPTGEYSLDDEELKKRSLDLHNDLTEHHMRKRRKMSRNFWDHAPGEDIDEEQMLESQKQSAVIREELKAEFLRKYAPRLERILQEYEKRGIEPKDESMTFDSIRWWARHGEVERILPILRSLPEQLEG